MHIFQMKFASVVKTGVLAVLAAGLLVSCQKESFNGGDKPLTNKITDKKKKEQIINGVQQLPTLGIYNATMNKVIMLDLSNPEAKTWTFADPDPGLNFATSNGGSGVVYAESGTVLIITDPSAGLGAGGGTVVAGGTSLDIDIAFCFSASDEDTPGGGLFGGGDFGDVAGVIGIAGDFEALASGDFSDDPEADPFDFFEGLAYYFVYAEDLDDDSYDVIEFFEAAGDSEDDFDGFAFAWVVAFGNGEGGVYLSADGDLTINGGSMAFDGEYYCIEGIGFFDEEGEGDEPEASIVSGYGEMGCDM